MKKRHNQSKLFWQSSILIVAMFLVVCFSLAYLGYLRFLELERENNLSQTEIKAELAKEWVTERYIQFGVLANVFEVAQNNRQIMRIMQGFETVDSSIYRKLYYVDRNYMTIDSSGLGSVSPVEFKKIFDKIGEREDTLLTKVEFYKDTKEPVFSIIAPMRNERKELEGILIGVISLDPLQTRLNSVGYHSGMDDENSSTWILDSEKQTILHSNQELILNFKLDHGEDFGYKNVDRLSQLIDKNSSGTISYTVQNKEDLFLSFVKTKINDGWIIMVGRLETSFLDYLSYNWGIKVAVMLFGITVLVFWQEYILCKIMKPFMQIKNSLMSFNMGNKHFMIGPKQNRASAELAEEIRKVTDTVISQSYNVESLIRERTKALSELNTSIASKNKELSEINAALAANNYRLQHKAMTDMLTQLLNRQEFLALAGSMMQEANSDYGKEFSILFLDLDNFKQYNDKFSHEIGDFVLRKISELIQNNVRAMDVSGRYGGDEFVILINHPDLQAAVSTAERILCKIQEVHGYVDEISEMLGQKVVIPSSEVLSCSIGVVRYSVDMKLSNVEELVALADDMMYQAKKAGKGRIKIYHAKETKDGALKS